MLTRVITAKLAADRLPAASGDRHADRHGREPRAAVQAAVSVDMIAVLHHDLELLVNLVVLGLSSGGQVSLKLIVRVQPIRASGGPALVFLLVQSLKAWRFF